MAVAELSAACSEYNIGSAFSSGKSCLATLKSKEKPLTWVGAVVALAVYFLPSFIGYKREVRKLGSLIVVNVFFGWTLLGWVVSLAMAMRTVDKVPS